MKYFTILYYTMLYYTILYDTILYYTIRHAEIDGTSTAGATAAPSLYIIMACILLCYSILYYIISYYVMLYYTTLYHSQHLATAPCGAEPSKNLRPPARDSSLQCSLETICSERSFGARTNKILCEPMEEHNEQLKTGVVVSLSR